MAETYIYSFQYRREFNITPTMANGTAGNIVAMVFGYMGNDCATGVGFTRNRGNQTPKVSEPAPMLFRIALRPHTVE